MRRADRTEWGPPGLRTDFRSLGDFGSPGCDLSGLRFGSDSCAGQVSDPPHDIGDLPGGGGLARCDRRGRL